MRSNSTSRLSASSPLRSNLAASLMFESGDLNSLHLNWAALNLAFHHEENENVASSLKKSTVKHRMKTEKKSHHHKAGHKSNNGQHKHSSSQLAHGVSKQPISASSDDSDPAYIRFRTQDHTASETGPTLNTRKDSKKKRVRGSSDCNHHGAE